MHTHVLCLVFINACTDLHKNSCEDQFVSYELMSKISETFLYPLRRNLHLCRREGLSGLKVHTPKWTLPKMDFFGELMTEQNFRIYMVNLSLKEFGCLVKIV